MTKPFDDGNWSLLCSGMELYGKWTKLKEDINSNILTYGRSININNFGGGIIELISNDSIINYGNIYCNGIKNVDNKQEYVDKFSSNMMSLQECIKLNINDKIVHRKKNGKFCVAIIIEKNDYIYKDKINVLKDDMLLMEMMV